MKDTHFNECTNLLNFEITVLVILNYNKGNNVIDLEKKGRCEQEKILLQTVEMKFLCKITNKTCYTKQEMRKSGRNWG